MADEIKTMMSNLRRESNTYKSSLERIIELIDERLEPISNTYHELHKISREAKKELEFEKLKNIETQIPEYTTRLERLKKTINAFIEQYPKDGSVEYSFIKVDAHTDDYHNQIHDPLDWTIREYDLLDMSKIMDIKFDYCLEEVKNFVDKWMKKNVDIAQSNNVEYGY
jgi:archaellum component FlaC